MIGYLFATLSAVTIAASSIAAKEALSKEHSLVFATAAHLTGSVLLLPFIGLVDLSIGPQQIATIYIAACFGTFAFWFVSKAIRYLEVSVVVPLLNLSVIMVVLLAYFFLDERLGMWKIAGIILIVFGAYLLELDGKAADILSPLRDIRGSRNHRIMFIGIFLYACAGIADRVALQDVDVITYLFFVYWFLTANYLVAFLVLRPVSVAAALREVGQTKRWLAACVLTRLVSNFFYAHAVALLFVGIASAVKRMSALITVIVGGRLFHERKVGWKLATSSLMVVGVILVVFS